MSDSRPCRGSNANVCVAEGCYGEACIRAAVERSSLGTPAAKALRASVSDVAAAKVVGMADGMAAEQRRVLGLLDSPDLLEDMAHAHYRNQMPADDWAEESAVWRVMHRADMHAALDVLRARIEEGT